MKGGIKNHSMLSGGGSLVPVAPTVFGNENPATAHISRRTEASLPGRPLLREVINRNSTDLHRNGSNAERFGICGSFISCNEKTGTIIPVVLLSSLTCCFVVVRFYDLLLFWRLGRSGEKKDTCIRSSVFLQNACLDPMCDAEMPVVHG